MTYLEQELKKRNISVYQICKALGKDPNGFVGSYLRKIRGKSTMTIEELNQIGLAIQDLSKTPFNTENVKCYAERFFVQ